MTPPEGETTEPSAQERPQEYLAEIGFDELGLSPELLRALEERGYTRPTPVQAQAYGPVMEGRDLIVRSKTGTGKTAAFGLPLLEKVGPGEKKVKALVLCPTRELALQVAAEIGDLGKHKGVAVTAIYGGAPMQAQENALESGSPLVVGTPGRVYDHIRRGNLDLSSCTHIVLDEADEMLNQGFYEEVCRILDKLPADRQVLLFSATVPEDIQRLIARYTQNAETLLLSGDVYTVEHIHHVRYDISDAYPKPRNLIYMLEMEEPQNAIIFCNTRDDTALVTAVLNRHGFDADLLNGDLPQKERERVMAKVKRGEVAFMVATDIAARGIDISDLGYVINYSLPEDPAVYVHRVGRTGRIGKKGVALNLVSGRELSTLSVLEKKYDIKFEKRVMPTPEKAMALWTERHVREIREAAGDSVYEGFLGLAAQMKGRSDADDLIAFLLKYFFSHLRMEKVQALDATLREVRESKAPRREERGPRERSGERERESRPRRPERGEKAERPPRRDRGERSDERPSRERRPAGIEVGEGQARLWIGLGADAGLDPSSLGKVLEGLGAPAGKLVSAELRGSFGYLVVAEEDVAAFEAISGKLHGDRTLKVERARPPGEEAPRRPSRPEVAEGQVRLWINLGTQDGLDETSLRSALEGAGAPVDKLERLELRDAFSYVTAKEEDAEAFEGLTGKQHGDKELKLERARPPRSRR